MNNIILRQSDHALLLPASSVQQDTLRRVEDGRLSPQKVKIGARGATEVEILAGEADGSDDRNRIPKGR